MFKQHEIDAIVEAAKTLRVEVAALKAVVEVESNRSTGTMVNGTFLPIIRWEGHYFDRLVRADLRQKARDAKLASPSVGGIKNPKSQSDRWRMLYRAMEIDHDAALMSVSVGIGQVMIAHWKTLGYASPSAMMDEARTGFAGQLNLMVKYIQVFGLVDELQRLDWHGFARGYNGPAYAKNGYHTKMEAAYKRYGGKASVTPTVSGMLRMGSTGAAVRELQTLLSRAGFAVKVDGDYGPATKAAVMNFQTLQPDLDVDGVAGPKTMAALNRYRFQPEEEIGAIPVTRTPGVGEGAGGVAGGVGLSVAADKIGDLGDKLAGSGVSAIEYLSYGLYAAAAILVVGGVLWAVRAHLETKKTTIPGVS